MMNIMIDGSAVTTEAVYEESIADLVKRLADDLGEDTSITKVRVDGNDFTGKFDLQDEPAVRFKNIELTSSPTRQVALDTLEVISEFHTSLVQEFELAGEQFRFGDEEKSNTTFSRCLDGLQVLLKTTLSATALLKLKPEEVQSDAGTLNEITQKVNRVLDELLEAQMQRDSILIADLLEYEMVPLMNDWALMISKLNSMGKQN